MEPTHHKHPVFEANQVLSNVHLNQNFDYLDEQGRLSRAHLIGTGIMNGLEVRVRSEVIEITRGCGITSEGYLVTLQNNLELTSYAPYTPPAAPAYSLFENEPLWELLESGAEDALPIDEAFLEGKRILLFVELKRQSLRNCSPGNCDDKGSEIIVSLKPLLAGLETTALDADPGKLMQAQINLPSLAIPRVDVPSTSPANPLMILKAFERTLSDTRLVSRTGQALLQAFDAFSPLAAGELSADDFQLFIDTFSFLETSLQSPAQALYLQYFHDFIRDLIEAYNELVLKGSNLLSACCPPPDTFPRHLLLGRHESPNSTNVLHDRHHFMPALMSTPLQNRRKEVQLLLHRIAEMIRSFLIPTGRTAALKNGFAFLEKPAIRITPDRNAEELLSRKSIPWYYRMNSDLPLYQIWNPAKTMSGKAHENLGYRSDEYSETIEAFVSSPLSFNLEPYPFLRVEGHIGQPYQHVVERLSELRSRYRLSFAIVVLHDKTEQSSEHEGVSHTNLREFLDAHPGISHRSGVPAGGTLVLVCQSSTRQKMLPSSRLRDPLAMGLQDIAPNCVIADFSLPYQVEKPVMPSGLLVKECAMNWIDSIRHMNNLALRQYRPTATRRAAASAELEKNRLKNHYVIRIYRYDIQSISLLPALQPVDIEIPLTGEYSLAAFRLSAVADQLNRTFSAGLVFDADPETNTLRIRSIEGQSFRLELGGIQGNMIRYAYDETGMYRHIANTWEPLHTNVNASSCRYIAGPYTAEDYAWLHRHHGPAKMKAVTPVTAEEVITWEKTTLKRARTFATANALPIYDNMLSRIAAEIRQIDPGAGIVLIGSWANGSWVSRNSSDNLNSFGSMHQLDNFLQLRRKVTGKTGSSGIEVMIDSTSDITADMLKLSTGYPLTVIKGKKDAQKGLVL